MAEPFDRAALADFLAGAIEGFHGLRSVEKFAGGQSNPTFKLVAASGSYVLRRKPAGTLLKSAHAIEREYQVMKALAATDVPVPRMLLLCEDESVIGTAFFVMDYLEGRIFWDPALPDLSSEDRAAVYDGMNAALAALHRVDVVSVGLSAFGRPGDYFARQLSRWTDQYRASETGVLSAMDRLIAWLADNLPPDDGRVSLVHGDYRIDNMIFDKNAPRLLALLDWELSTLGHPFADLAYQCMQWRLPNQGRMRGLAGVDRAAIGLPSEAQYVARYCERMGLAGIPNWTFYLAFSFFRLAAILQGVKKRALDGNASNPEAGLKMGEAVPVLAQMAILLIDEGTSP
ncbi:MAG: phosphotransferase family protein [Beijerinckiaceae bacterium]|nr:phosphotransferase family protein [Beijerinckiaceae bacterium]